MQVLNIFHVLVAIAMVAFILLQRGAGATAGAAFGSGASGTVFGARGSGSFMSRSTWILATLFCLISLTMAVVVSRTGTQPETDLGVVGAPAAVEAPVTSEDVPVETLTSDRVEGDRARDDRDGPAMDDGTPETDLPPIDAVTEPAVDAANPVDSEGDLPVVDSAAEAPVEDAASDTGVDETDS